MIKLLSKTTLVLSIFVLSGCSTIDTVKKYWPRPHDPSMFNQLVIIDTTVEQIDCEKADWSHANIVSEQLAKYTEWRNDPQQDNIKGLHSHAIKMNSGASKTFCELGKKTASQRVNATKTAWENR